MYTPCYTYYTKIQNIIITIYLYNIYIYMCIHVYTEKTHHQNQSIWINGLENIIQIITAGQTWTQ